MLPVRKRKLLDGHICRINMVGIELEGGWRTLPKGYRDVVHDGSVKFDALRVEIQNELLRMERAGTLTPTKQDELLGRVPTYVGELVSKPLKPEEAREWVDLCYPHMVNDTCGLHVHMSFTSKLYYQRLMTPDFAEKWLIGEIRKWAKAKDFAPTHPIWERIDNPDHRHCAHKYLGIAQATMDRKDYNSRGTKHSRYTAVNYCYAQHGTVECRVLPMFDTAKEANEAINVVVSATNRYLAKNRKREKSHQIIVPEMAAKELFITSQV